MQHTVQQLGRVCWQRRHMHACSTSWHSAAANRCVSCFCCISCSCSCSPCLRLFCSPPPGAYELLATDVLVLNTVSKPLPFPISASEEGQEAREEVRLKHRVLDLR